MYLVEMNIRGKWTSWHAFRHKTSADEYMENQKTVNPYHETVNPYHEWRIREVTQAVTEFDKIKELLLQWEVNPGVNEIQV
jgi:hypothetical protein